MVPLPSWNWSLRLPLIPSLKPLSAAAVWPPSCGGHCNAAVVACRPKKSCAGSPTKATLVRLKVKVPSFGLMFCNPAEKIGLTVPLAASARPIFMVMGNLLASLPAPNSMVDLIWNDCVLASLIMPSVWLVILKAEPNSQGLIGTSTPPSSHRLFLYLRLVRAKTKLASVGSRFGTPGLSVLSTLTVAAWNSAGVVPCASLSTTPAISMSRPPKRNLKPSMPPLNCPVSLHCRRAVMRKLGLSTASPNLRSIGIVALKVLAVRSNSASISANSPMVPPSL